MLRTCFEFRVSNFTHRGPPCLRSAWFLAVGLFFAGLAIIPIFVLLYAASGALFGLAILLTLALVQLPLYLLLRRWLPPVEREPID